MIGELSDEGKDEPYFKFINSDYMQQDITTQASIIQALLNNTIKIDVSPLFSSILYAVLIFYLIPGNGTKEINIYYYILCRIMYMHSCCHRYYLSAGRIQISPVDTTYIQYFIDHMQPHAESFIYYI